MTYLNAKGCGKELAKGVLLIDVASQSADIGIFELSGDSLHDK